MLGHGPADFGQRLLAGQSQCLLEVRTLRPAISIPQHFLQALGDSFVLKKSGFLEGVLINRPGLCAKTCDTNPKA